MVKLILFLLSCGLIAVTSVVGAVKLIAWATTASPYTVGLLMVATVVVIAATIFTPDN